MAKFMFIGLFLLVFTRLAYAHAVVTEDSLKTTPIHAQQATKVELSFNSKIELGLSQIFLVSKGDKHTLLEIAKGHKQGQIIIHVPALESGDYALRLKVFAADGHLTEDVIHFSVSR
ncbi:MAG: copper resistance protein CopC [Methylovulum sp.]|uniref:copper resistance CopC family protein n=1 Tax=Methylovulum sp. TaxID=1916980 RepID=UPI002626C810|nr:copper resistance CopC family protein [Methylovulum sp.]MDD2725180.1 copper resistance protein CopC [Methylovulum sp.]MDD5124387.1 copper resistance protein CopC [Methylovulum sp.]